MTNQDWIDRFDSLPPPADGTERQNYKSARLAYANDLEERRLDVRKYPPLDVQAKYQRWLGEYLKCPRRIYGGRIYAWSVSLWSPSYCRLPHEIFEWLPSALFWPDPRRTLVRGRYRSRIDAERALMFALDKILIL